MNGLTRKRNHLRRTTLVQKMHKQPNQRNRMKHLSLDDFALFIEVAAAQSLSKVARSRHVAASHVSRHFARIEAQCHLRLAHRTTHRLSLTDDGEVFLEIARRIVQEHAQLQGSMGARSQAVMGTVRISISQLFAQHVVIGRLAELRAAHPGLHVDLHISDALVNMAYDGVDIAVRAGIAPLGSVIARSLGSHGRALYAAQGYLKKHGTPRVVADLKAHSLIANSAVATHNRWQFSVKGQVIEELVQGHIRVNSSAAVVSLVLAGAGIGRVNDVVGKQLVEQGLLQQVLGRYSSPVQYPAYAAILAERYRAPKIRATMDFLTLCFAGFRPPPYA